MIQLADVLTGAATARLNRGLNGRSAKMDVVRVLETCLGGMIQQTGKREQKFNVFMIDLQGGW